MGTLPPPWTPTRARAPPAPVDAMRHLQLLGVDPDVADASLPPITSHRGDDGTRLYAVANRVFVSRTNADAWRRQAALDQAELLARAVSARRFARAASEASLLSASLNAPPPSPHRSLMALQHTLHLQQQRHSQAVAAVPTPTAVVPRTAAVVPPMPATPQSAARYTAKDLGLGASIGSALTASADAALAAGRLREAALQAQLDEARAEISRYALRSRGQSELEVSRSDTALFAEARAEAARLRAQLDEAAQASAAVVSDLRAREIGLRQEVATLTMRLAALSSLSALSGGGGRESPVKNTAAGAATSLAAASFATALAAASSESVAEETAAPGAALAISTPEAKVRWSKVAALAGTEVLHAASERAIGEAEVLAALAASPPRTPRAGLLFGVLPSARTPVLAMLASAALRHATPTAASPMPPSIDAAF